MPEMVPKSAWEVSANLRARSKREKSFTPGGNLLIQERLYTAKASAALQNSLESVEDRQKAGVRNGKQEATGGGRRRAGGRRQKAENVFCWLGPTAHSFLTYCLPPLPPVFSMLREVSRE